MIAPLDKVDVILKRERLLQPLKLSSSPFYVSRRISSSGSREARSAPDYIYLVVSAKYAPT